MLPLGIAYFTVAVTGLAMSLGLIAAPVAALFGGFNGGLWVDDIHVVGVDGWWALPLCFIVGVVLLFATLHLARGVGYLHGQLAKHMLVKTVAARLTGHLPDKKEPAEMPALSFAGDRPRPDSSPRFSSALAALRLRVFAMKSRTCGYTCVRQRRPLKMP